MTERQPIDGAMQHHEEALQKEVKANVSVSRLEKEDEAILPEYVSLLREGLYDIPRPEESLQQDLVKNTVELYTERLNDENYYLYTARNDNGELVGVSYGVVRSKPGVSEKYKVVGHFGLTIVRSDSRGNRIGGQLKEAFEQDCAKRGVPFMTTFIYDANKSSIAMNKRMGMQEITDDPVLVPVDNGRFYAKPTPPLKPSQG
jgi:GNAT superfamily N-acetyltransferase